MLDNLTPAEWAFIICFVGGILIMVGTFLPYIWNSRTPIRIQYGDILIEVRSLKEMEKALEGFATYKGLGIPPHRRRNMRPIVTPSEN